MVLDFKNLLNLLKLKNYLFIFYYWYIYSGWIYK